MNPFGILGSSRKRSRNADAVITGAGSGIGAAFAAELARRGGRVVCSDIDEASARAPPTPSSPRAARPLGTHCDVTAIDDVSSARQGGTGLVRRRTDPGGQQRRRRRRRHRHRRDRPRRLELGAGHQPVGPDPRLPRLHADPARGRPTRRASSTSPPRRRSAPHPAWPPTTSARPACCRCRRPCPPNCRGTGVNVTVLCPTFVKTNIVDAGRITDGVDPARRPADALDRLLARAGGPDVPGHPRPRRPVLHAPARRPDRLGHQAFHSDRVHPRRRTHHVASTDTSRRSRWPWTWT